MSLIVYSHDRRLIFSDRFKIRLTNIRAGCNLYTGGIFRNFRKYNLNGLTVYHVDTCAFFGYYFPKLIEEEKN